MGLYIKMRSIARRDMMKKALLGLVIGGMVALAAEPGGTATTAAGMSVNGAALPATGAKSWPVQVGDEVRTAGAPTVLTLRDGSKIVLGAQSVLRLEKSAAGGESVRLVSGGMRYQMAGEGKTQLVANGKALPAGPGATGTVGQVVMPVVQTSVVEPPRPSVIRKK